MVASAFSIQVFLVQDKHGVPINGLKQRIILTVQATKSITEVS